ncbi:MAG: thiamine pyrophosphate-dependent enzyme, partial [Pseudomonadota bacterium]
GGGSGPSFEAAGWDGPTPEFDFSALAKGMAVDVAARALVEVGLESFFLEVGGEVRVRGERLGGGRGGVFGGKKLAAVDQRGEIADRWRIWREEKARREQDDLGQGLNSASVFAALTRQAPEDAVIAVDVGNNTYSFGRYFECKRQSVLMSGYLGSIGFAFPAAMGAWAAVGHQRPILSVSGDGGFGQYMGEFNTAVKYGMNITHVLLNNAQLGKITKEQRAGEWPVWQTSLHNPNFAEYAELCGGYGIRIERKEDLDEALADAIAREGPALVEVLTDAELV